MKKITNEDQLIEEGDVVDHKVFGLGRAKSVGFIGHVGAGSNTGNGYPVTVVWDDPARPESGVMDWALTKVSSSNVRPYIFWDKKWQPLREEWLNARRLVEQLCTSFEPEWPKLDVAIDAEEAAWVKMRDFINTPRG
ncbi:hypothetical protein [Pseudomonas sp. EL_65y_Pfl1_R32]|uniref:hypothetical protein n=1 Tax=Pseudomonas sp. EL_65y_Pfl1_R32 TaxID=3088696 RepID=UPI0030D7CE61